MRRFQKLIIVVLALVVLAPVVPVNVSKAHACGVIGITCLDVPRAIGEAIHTAAIVAAQQAVQSITHSLINWINSGFDGSPAFATNLGVNLRQVADGAALQFIGDLEKDASIHSPYISYIISNLRTAYLFASSPDAVRARLQYDLTQYAHNDIAFRAGNFNEGGFNAWMAMTLHCGNDPYCAQYAAQEDLNKHVDSAVNQLTTELNWGQGFLSWRGACTNSSGQSVALSDADKSSHCKVLTPGQTIAGRVTFLANQPELQLTVANSIDQIVAALANELIAQVIGPNGLLGGGSSSGGGNGIGSAVQQSGSTGGNLGGTLASSFIQSLQSQRSNVAFYQSSWQDIHDAATRAAQACAVLGSSSNQTDVAGVLAQSNAAITKATVALAAIDALVTRATQAQSLTGAAQGSAVENVNRDYHCLLGGGTPNGDTCTPAPSTASIGTICPVSSLSLLDPGEFSGELTCIIAQSQDTAGTLLHSMNQIADGFCH